MNVDYLDSFGEWLRQRRERLGLTRAELAACASCSVSGLRKIEGDERRPSRQLAELLAVCLSVPAEEQAPFVEAARGRRPVARLGRPAPRVIPQPLPAPPITSGASARSPATQPDWNLPVPATPLIGREAELATLVQLVGDSDCRLLTVFGPGGIGKTRLAIEAACAMWPRFGDGVFFASLASLDATEHLVPTMAQAVGLNFSGPANPRIQLVNYLRNKQALLLLDNLEHLLDGVDLLVEMLEQAPELRLLVTSRERLELQAEWVFEVQGLPVPAADEVAELERYSSVQLFLQRARQARLDFELSVEACPDIVRICRLAEGMPLAIELAAAWVPVLSCEEIADEIERSIDVLATTMRDVPERQRSIRAVFDHSWQLLSAEEQQGLRSLSVFRGGFTRQGAEMVAGADLPVLSKLVVKSFVRPTSTGRFTMHELVRQYMAQRLAEVPEEEKAARDRHSTYYTAFAAQLEGQLKGAGQLQALAEMDAEIDNIRAAWRWAVRRSHTATMRKPIRALWYFYDIRGWFQEAEAGFAWAADTLESSLSAQAKSEPAVATLIAYARAQQGWFCLRTGRFEQAQRLLDSNLQVLRAAHAHVELVDALQHAGALNRLMGDYTRSRASFQEMWQYALQTGDPWNATIAEGNIGLADHALGAYEEARDHMMANVASFGALGDRRMLAVALHFLGGTSCMLGSYDEARAYLHESLALSRAIGDRWIEAMTLRELGCVAQQTGASADAVSLFQESLGLAREIGEHWSILQALVCLGGALLALGDHAAAQATFTEELAMAWEMQVLPNVLAALGGLARWSVLQGVGEESQQEALTSILFVLNHPAATHETRDDARQLRSELERRLAPDQVEAAEASARTILLERHIETILSSSIG